MNTVNNIAEMQKGISFLELIKSKKIQIPIIQRDYAQGRLDPKATEIRDNFLISLIDALTIDYEKPLILDFIYGSTDDDNLFVPLDGQQRLTTLFLLHWYLASKDDLLNLQTIVDNSTFSKFTYETRISSKDFCNSLICHSIDSIGHDKSGKSLSKSIKNQPWFMWAWHKDPTVKAMLVMLDEMDDRLGHENKDQRISMWNNLNNGKITFHLLPLEKFDLTDELYVKMNARGKELSKFDILKATLEEQMRLNNVTEEVQNKWISNIDSNWIDLFWNKLAKPNLKKGVSESKQQEYVKSVEDSYLRFIKRMMVFYLFTNNDCLSCNWNDEKIKRYVPFEYEENNILNKLREFSVRNDVLKIIPLFCRTKFFSQNFFEFLINAFDSIIYKFNNKKNEGSELIENISFEAASKTIFEAFISENIFYETRVQFYALLQFYKYNKAKDTFQSEKLKTEFNNWMRIIRNLSTNTNTYIYNTYDDFLKSLLALKKWANQIYGDKKQLSVNTYFEKENIKSGFNTDQLTEESIKVSLINRSNPNSNWHVAIRKAEEHKYFLGQIRFLLEWSKEKKENNAPTYNLSKFNEYFDKILSVFDENGLKEELSEPNKHTFRTALMKTCDYYLFNNCFIDNTDKNRDYSWKRYLREINKSINMKNLLDKWCLSKQPSFKTFCENEIQFKGSDWRKYFIDKPEIYNELYNNKISWWHWESREISLLSKTRWSSRHKELRTFYWYLKYKSANDKYLISTDETNPFSAIFYKNEKNEFSVKFIPSDNSGMKKGKYVVSSNYDPKITEMRQNTTNFRWEKIFDSDNPDDVENILKTLYKQDKSIENMA